MTTHEVEHRVDRTGWKPGPWDNEPDKVQFEHMGLTCLVVRVCGHGALCGYVGVPPGHPLRERTDSYMDWDFDVHGGITYTDKCRGSVCHVPKPGAPDDLLWIGFDCAHAEDLCPGYTWYYDLKLLVLKNYRDLESVKSECRRLAEQVVAMAER